MLLVQNYTQLMSDKIIIIISCKPSKVVTMANRDECNFIRLLHRCEEMAASNEYDNWRLEKV